LFSAERTAGALRRLIDCGCIAVSYWVALHIAYSLDRRGLFTFPRQWSYEYGAFLGIALVAWIALASYTRIYRSHRAERLDFAARGLLRTLALWAMFTTAGVFLLKLSTVSRQFIIYVFVLSGGLILVRQALTMMVLRRLHRFGYNWRSALIIGGRQDCERFADILTRTFPNGYQVVLAPVDADNHEALLTDAGGELPGNPGGLHRVGCGQLRGPRAALSEGRQVGAYRAGDCSTRGCSARSWATWRGFRCCPCSTAG
jgi:FlaA1/EpsC-like NDP-sugar epimerase